MYCGICCNCLYHFPCAGLSGGKGNRHGYHKDESCDYIKYHLFHTASVGILLGVIALSGCLGTPWPWLRLSVIGALHYETQIAEAAAEQVGMSSLSAAEMTPTAFTTIALLMSVCIIWGMVLSIFFNKKYTRKLSDQKNSSGAGFGIWP